MAATRKILNTGTNKYQNAVREMKRAIYSDNVYVALHANTITDNVDNTLESLNELWMTNNFMQRVVRDNYRLCFPRVNWTKSESYDFYDPTKLPQTQNCYVFDDKIGNGVLFLCVGNDLYNKTDEKTASVYRPSNGYASVTDLPSGVIEQDDGYKWIALAQTDNRFTDSSWMSLEVRDGISFFGADEGQYVDDGVTLIDFKQAVCGGVSFGQTGAANFYAVNNSYNQTTSSEVSSGSVLFASENIERYEAFLFQQSFKLNGNDTQVRFDSGNSAGALPSTITPVPLDEQIANSPFTNSSPLGWYNKRVQEWAVKAGSVEMVWLDPVAGGLSESDFTYSGSAEPAITAKGNDVSPTVEFITKKINDNTWLIRGVKISTNLSTNERMVGSGNTVVEFNVTNTDNNSGFSDSIKYLLTPYGGLLKEENLYGPIIPVNAFMMSVEIKETDITTALDQAASTKVLSPTIFDAYSLVVDAQNSSNSRELGLDLPPNKVEFLDNLMCADFTPIGGHTDRIAVGDHIYINDPTVIGDSAVGDFIGVVQAIEQPIPITGGSPMNIAFSTSKPAEFVSAFKCYIGRGTAFYNWGQTTTNKADPDAKPLTGTVVHIGKSDFNLSSATSKRITIKYITRV